MSMTEAAHARVTYRFHAPVAPAGGWHVRSVRIDERISAPYEAVVALVGGRDDDPERLLARSCTLEVRRGARARPIHGIVSRVDTGASGVEVTLVPALRVLELGSDCRIFAERSVPEVVEAVLGPALRAHGRELVKRLRHMYPVREYVVQHRESDLAFVARLLAEAGIWYHFEHPVGRAGEAAEVLCLVDDNDEAPRARLGSGGARIPLELDHTGLAQHEAITELVASAALGCTGVTVRAYNWTHPGVFAEATAPGAETGARPWYAPDAAHFSAYGDGRYAASDAATQAARSWERHAGATAHARCVGNVTALVPGQRVEIERDGAVQRFVVTRVRATGRDAVNAARALQHLEDYQCAVELAPAAHPLRPPLLPRPRVHGIQTGHVVGPDGRLEVEPGFDDVHVDEHGRVRVKLSWDRTAPGREGATATCFLRVAQAWAGAGFGVHFTPRIGTEVVVSFVGGDPDRPIVTGCVHDGLSEPPFRLPADKTQSGIRTQSSPRGEGYSAFTFEDAAGKELVSLRAQRDHAEWVGHAQTIEVGSDRKVQVGGDDAAHVAGDRNTSVKGSERYACAGGRLTVVAGDDLQRFGREHYVKIGGLTRAEHGGGRTVEVASVDELFVTRGGDKRAHVEGRYTMHADRELLLSQGDAWLQLAESAVRAQAAGEVALANPGFSLRADAEGNATLTAARSLVIEVGATRIALSSDGKLEIRGLTCTLRNEKGALTLAPEGATLKSPITHVEGEQLTQVKGRVIRLN